MVRIRTVYGCQVEECAVRASVFSPSQGRCVTRTITRFSGPTALSDAADFARAWASSRPNLDEVFVQREVRGPAPVAGVIVQSSTLDADV